MKPKTKARYNWENITRKIRTLTRHRGNLIKSCSREILHLQKEMEQMNLKLDSKHPLNYTKHRNHGVYIPRTSDVHPASPTLRIVSPLSRVGAGIRRVVSNIHRAVSSLYRGATGTGSVVHTPQLDSG